MREQIYSTSMLRGDWELDAKNLPDDAPPYARDMAQRILWLISDVNTMRGQLARIRAETGED